MSTTTESGLGTKDKPDEDDTLLTTETIEFEGRLYKAIEGNYDYFTTHHSRRWDNTSDQLKREWELPEVYIGAKWKELDDGLQEFIIGKWEEWGAGEGGPGSGPQKSGSSLQQEQMAMRYINPDYDAFSKDEGNPYTSPMIDSESLAKEEGSPLAQGTVQDYYSQAYDNDEAIKDTLQCEYCFQQYNTNTTDDQTMIDHVNDKHNAEFSNESKAEEEGMGSVSGPPAGTEPTVREEKDNTFVLPADSNEKLSDKEELADRELEQSALGEVSEIDSIMLNENYIQLGDVLYRPRYTSEEAWSDDLIFENKFFTSEGVGNCQFCKGAGKITVERLGLKECPDCEGTGDVQGNPMAQDPMTQEPILGEVPEVPNIQQEEVPDVTEPKKPNPFAKGESKKKSSEGFIASPNIPESIQTSNREMVNVGGASPETQNVHDTVTSTNHQCPECPWNITSPWDNYGTSNDGRHDYEEHYKETHMIGESISKTDCPNCNFTVAWKEGDDTQKQDAERELREHKKNKHSALFYESKKKAKESCKPCRKTMAHEASVSKFKSFVNSKINILQKRAKAGESVSLMYGLPTVTRQGRKIKGTLAYAGVSLNDRIYLPEELEKGDGLTLPLLLNHSSIAGAEDELDRLDDKMLEALYNEEDYEVGEVTLTWDPEKLTLFYTGVVENEFFQKEIDDMDMAVSLGIYYDSDSPRICDVNCYTLIKGAEFREVSLVYHAGFPIATIEAVEAQLKKRALKSIEKEEKLSDTIDRINKKNEPEGGWREEDKVEEADDDYGLPPSGDTMDDIDYAYSMRKKDEEEIPDPDGAPEESEEAVAEEETDELARGGAVDVEEIKDEGPAPTIDLNDEWDGQTIVTEMFTGDNFSVRGVMGMTISNANGVERYQFDPTMNYGTNTIHFDTHNTGATIYGESLQFQPVMGTPEELTKEIESKPDIVIEDADKDAFESVKKKKKVKKRG